jgi:hypothetical protein
MNVLQVLHLSQARVTSMPARLPSYRVSFYRRGDIPVPHPLCADFPVRVWRVKIR